jgi:hypothetical protein
LCLNQSRASLTTHGGCDILSRNTHLGIVSSGSMQKLTQIDCRSFTCQVYTGFERTRRQETVGQQDVESVLPFGGSNLYSQMLHNAPGYGTHGVGHGCVRRHDEFRV